MGWGWGEKVVPVQLSSARPNVTNANRSRGATSATRQTSQLSVSASAASDTAVVTAAEVHDAAVAVVSCVLSSLLLLHNK